MRFIGKVDGFVNDFNNDKLFQKQRIQVNYTADNIGKTLSLGTEDGLQISIPFDEILKVINKESKK